MMTCQPGETRSVKFGRLTHVRNGVISADAVITCVIHNAVHAVVDTVTGTAFGANGDWYADFNAPATAGIYHIVATVEAESATEERELVFEVKPIA